MQHRFSGEMLHMHIEGGGGRVLTEKRLFGILSQKV